MYTIFFIVLSTIINNGNSEFVKCIAQCIELKNCEEAQLLLKEKGINPEICGFNDTEPMVCCSENDEKTLFAFHYGDLRKADKKCKEFNPPKIFRRNDEFFFSKISPSVYGYRVTSGFQFLAAIGYGNPKNPLYRCGGFLVKNNVVITAAHCLELNGEPPTQVLIGSYHLSSNVTKPIQILKVIPHPNYENQTYVNDIGIIILAEDSKEKPACLFTQRLNLRHDNRTIAAGFGTTSFGGPFAKELIKVYMNIIDKKACQKEYGTQSIVDSQLCVFGERRIYENGTSGIQDTCQGDSGGPLVLNRNGNYVVGIVSNGRPCGSEAPGIYTYISPFINWIKSVIRQEGSEEELEECVKLNIPYRTLSTCDQSGVSETSCNDIAYIGDITSRIRPAFMATLGYGDIENPEYKCDGFFIDHNVVITAAQCAKINGKPPLVVQNVYDKGYSTRETQIIKVAKVISHPNYQSETYLNDIAIIFLTENSNRLTEEYACLYTSSLKFGTVNQAFALSFGRKSFDGPLLTDLFVVPINVVNKGVCEKQYKSGPLFNSHLCGLTQTDYVAEDTYEGNSGGPIFLKHYYNSTGTSFYVNKTRVIEPYYVVGIISYKQGVGIFTNITAYLDWIEAIVWPNGTEKERLYIA